MVDLDIPRPYQFHKAFEASQVRLNRSVVKAWTDAAGEPQALGFHVFRYEDGRSTQNVTARPRDDAPGEFFNTLLQPQSPAVWNTCFTLHLRQEAAKQLQRELADMFKRYPPAETDGNKPYIVRLAMAPLAD